MSPLPSVAQERNRCTLEPTRRCVYEDESHTPVTSGRDYEYETTPDTFHMVRCNSCGLLYLNPRPNPRPGIHDLPTIYPENYYSTHFTDSISSQARAVKL